MASEMAPLDPAAEEFPIPFLLQDSELLDCLLRPKIAVDCIDSRFTDLVHDVGDVFALPPDQLAARHRHAPGARGDKAWYFFSTRLTRGGVRRVGGDGSKRWCSVVGSKKEVAGGGYCQRFRYKEKTALGVVAPGWMMVEYGVAQEHAVGDGIADLVLCKIFRSPRVVRSDSKSSSSSTSASASPSSSGGRKRKAGENSVAAVAGN